ncbi:anhydro-N-acetylmuramic acid kinase [Candidatus Pelagibacter bacterium]|nr:anhydro-N-acetylmuramic acid kinase [Candidatus Pelagibacter bacterium]
MQKKWISLGLMSGTSGDGVDASIIRTDGINEYESIKDKYFEYNSDIYKDIHNLKEKIHKLEHLEIFQNEINNLERKITIFHAEIIKELNLTSETLIGFHGQTIYHNPKEKISKQLANGKLLNQLTKKNIVFNFRMNDILHGGEGAPLTPIFHNLLAFQKKIKLPVCFLNIGGISNITIVRNYKNLSELFSRDIGPGNCLIDAWVRKNSDKKFDHDGQLALSGTRNEIIFEQAQELYINRNNKKLSFDTTDFDISFVRGLNFEDGVATLTDFTASVIGEELSLSLKNLKDEKKDILLCGGGRKNKVLIKKIEENISSSFNLKLVDEYKIDGDFIESQAFAFLAVRSILKLPISFPSTTGCNTPCTGGDLIKN